MLLASVTATVVLDLVGLCAALHSVTIIMILRMPIALLRNWTAPYGQIVVYVNMFIIVYY